MLAAPFAGARSSERLIDLALPYWGTRGGARDERTIGAVAPEAWPRYAPRRILERRTWAAIRPRHSDLSPRCKRQCWPIRSAAPPFRAPTAPQPTRARPH